MKKISKACLLAFCMLLALTVHPGLLHTNAATRDARTGKKTDSTKLPEYAKKFYQALEESTDNDGKKDYLIMDKYFKPGNAPSILSDKPKMFQVTRTADRTCMLVAKFSGNDTNYETVTEQLGAVYHDFLSDHPEVFWLNTAKETIYSRIKVTYPDSRPDDHYVFLVLKRFGADSYDIRENYTQKKIQSDRLLMNQKLKRILSDMPDGSDADKVRYFNNWLTRNNGYNSSQEKDYPLSVYSSLTAILGNAGTKGPVCQAYSGAFKVLCDRAGIPCVIAATSDHGWNYVKIGQLWYAVDVTWNDTVCVNNDGTYDDAMISGYENEVYLMNGSQTKNSKGKTFLESHNIPDDQLDNYISAFAPRVTWSKNAYDD